MSGRRAFPPPASGWRCCHVVSGIQAIAASTSGACRKYPGGRASGSLRQRHRDAPTVALTGPPHAGSQSAIQFSFANRRSLQEDTGPDCARYTMPLPTAQGLRKPRTASPIVTPFAILSTRRPVSRCFPEHYWDERTAATASPIRAVLHGSIRLLAQDA